MALEIAQLDHYAVNALSHSLDWGYVSVGSPSDVFYCSSFNPAISQFVAKLGTPKAARF